MSDDINTQFRLDLDAEEFKKQLTDVNEKLDAIHGDTHTTGVATMFTAFAEGANLAKEAIDKLGESAEWVFDQVLDAEKVKAVNFQFDALAKNAGLSSTEMRDGFEKAAQGMTPTVEILKVANVALLNLGSGASKMPALFDVARKSAALMGGTALEKFEMLSRAVEFGNKRMLRQAGIAIDVADAQKKYADSLGITTENLDENLKKQAILNAVLEFSRTKMVSAPDEIRPVTIEWAKLKTAVVEMGEALGNLFNKAYGVYFSGIMSGLSKVAGGIKEFLVDKFGEGADQAKAHLARVRDSVFDLKEQIAAINKNPESSIPFTAAHERLQSLTAQLAKMREELVKAQAAAKEGGGSTSKPGGKSDLQKSIEAARIKTHKEAEEAMAKEDKAYADTKLRLDKEEESNFEKTQKNAVDANKSAKMRQKIIGQEYMQDIEAINALDLKDKQKTATLKVAADKKYTAALLANDKKLKEDLKKDEKALFDYKKAASDSFTSNYMDSLKAMGSGQKDASEAMKGFFFGALGDMATKQGAFMVLDSFKNFPAVMVPELVAGGALIALGAELGSMGGGSSGATALASAGGYSSSDFTGQTLAPPTTGDNSLSANAAQAPKSSITIAVSGNYFETEETKRRLAEIIREHQDATDFTFKQIGQA